VIGGGDWARDRLIPNTVRSVINQESVLIRDSEATRPWLHVLDVLSGYILVGQKLLEGDKYCAKAWNFGSSDEGNISVEDAVKIMQEYWSEIKIDYDKSIRPHEAKLLNLDSSQSAIELKWFPVWKIRTAIEKTTLWYKNYINSKTILSSIQINEYMADAKEKGLVWME
jgi:CDP-glucose 4,6-dehydratase